MTREQEVISFYSNRFQQHGDSYQAFDYGSRLSQAKRFEVLARVGDLEGSSVLDVGCGTADFYLFLQEKGIRCEYHGCDLVPEFIAAARQKAPGRFYAGDFLDVEFNRQFDYVICSGMLNFLGQAEKSRAFAILDKMVALATKAVGVNFHSSLARQPGAHYVVAYDPCQVLAYSLARYSSRLVLDHSYFPHDFTLFVYKKPFPEPGQAK
ncbi:MAG: class I SAM-dependent methyltransferase [Syntrophomonadaceae bacterium]|nr:class I SAM-dependent methyltransferase [Syntrophomonadaceae bacterium]